MPRNVRNFWIELEIDGRKTKVATGPRSRDGGFNLKVLMREKGQISEKEFRLTGYPTMDKDGDLCVKLVGVMADKDSGDVLFNHESKM